METKFRDFETRDLSQVAAYMKALYLEDTEGQSMTDEKIRKTLNFLTANPSSGNILVFEYEEQIVGYALLINFWSNEYGGVILNLDEIYVNKDFRGKGIAKEFIRFLIQSKFNNSVAIQLQVMPSNDKAYQLYVKLGFKKDKNRFLFYQF